MRTHRAGALAAGILCAAAATVTVWSGPLAAASSDFRARTPSAHVAAVHPAASTTTVAGG